MLRMPHSVRRLMTPLINPWSMLGAPLVLPLCEASRHVHAKKGPHGKRLVKQMANPLTENPFARFQRELVHHVVHLPPRQRQKKLKELWNELQTTGSIVLPRIPKGKAKKVPKVVKSPKIAKTKKTPKKKVKVQKSKSKIPVKKPQVKNRKTKSVKSKKSKK